LFVETGTHLNEYGHDDVYYTQLWTKAGFLVFSNRPVDSDGMLADFDDLNLICARCGAYAEWE
jgi:hypothetical protein